MAKTRGSSEQSSVSRTPNDLPNDFLMPWLLLIVRNWSMHGYQILQTLTILGLAAFDPSTVYRTLRRLEKDGLIVSAWQTGDSGPAKRVYSLTEAGQAFLKTWASTLEQYQGILSKFFEVYTEQIGRSGKGGKATSPRLKSTVTRKKSQTLAST